MISSCAWAALAAATIAWSVDVVAEAGDVLAHGAGEQLDILRQITDVLAEILAVPLVEAGAVEVRMLPENGCQMPTSVRTSVDLPDALGPITASSLPGGISNEIFDRISVFVSGAATRRLSTARCPSGFGNAYAALGRRTDRQQGFEFLVGFIGLHRRPPVRDDLLDRRERAAIDDGAGDDRAGRNVAAHGEPGADREHHGLQQQTQCFRNAPTWCRGGRRRASASSSAS